MNIKKIREIAKEKGVNAGDMNRPDLIRAIQRRTQSAWISIRKYSEFDIII
jgi:hypothetical protein